MRQVWIDGTGIQTSRLGIGTSSLHHLLLASARRRLLEHAWERGIRYFDTAPLYGHEMAERELGKFLRGRRDSAVVATKFGLLPSPVLSRAPLLMYGQKLSGRLLGKAAAKLLTRAPARDYSARHARVRVERSLALLGTDYIDILYLHEPTLTVLEAPEELVATLAQLQRAGKIRRVGVSGTLEDCASISSRFPALGEVWQVSIATESELRVSAGWNGREVQVTFGHFRTTGAPASAAEAADTIRRKLAAATALNRGGVILFSTRRTDHLDDIVAMLDGLEAPAWRLER